MDHPTLGKLKLQSNKNRTACFYREGGKEKQFFQAGTHH
jgi:hypothetical protein